MKGFSSEDWLENFESLTLIRWIHKFFPKEANYLFQAFGDQIFNSLISKKTKIQINALYFIKEVVNCYANSQIDPRIIFKFPSILIKIGLDAKLKGKHFLLQMTTYFLH